MSRTLLDRRRAERFAQLLDEAEKQVAHRHRVRSGQDRELSPLVRLGGRLGTTAPRVDADPVFRDGLRAMLMATIEREGIGATAVDPEADRRTARRITRTRLTVVAGVAAGALAVSGVSAASGDAKPGDTLYQIKRSTEQAQLALARSDSARGALYLEFARVRLGEAGQVPAGLLPEVLLDMDAETRQGAKLLATAAVEDRDPQALAAVDRFVEGQRAALVGLIGELPAEGRARATESMQVLDAVSARIGALRAAMACGAPTVSVDELGPRAAACAPHAVPQPETGATTADRPAKPGERTPAPAGTAPTAGPTPSAGPTPTPSPAGGGLLDEVSRVLGEVLG